MPQHCLMDPDSPCWCRDSMNTQSSCALHHAEHADACLQVKAAASVPLPDSDEEDAAPAPAARATPTSAPATTFAFGTASTAAATTAATTPTKTGAQPASAAAPATSPITFTRKSGGHAQLSRLTITYTPAMDCVPRVCQVFAQPPCLLVEQLLVQSLLGIAACLALVDCCLLLLLCRCR
jgi:hypothetical protein